MKELSFFRISFDWTHSSRCFVPYKSLSQKPHYKHVLSDRTRFLMIFSVQYHQAMGLTFSIKFSDKSHAFHGTHLFHWSDIIKSKHFTSWESPEIVTCKISILYKGVFTPEIPCRHRTGIGEICCQFK